MNGIIVDLQLVNGIRESNPLETLALEIERKFLESVTSIEQQKPARVSNPRDRKSPLFFIIFSARILEKEGEKEGNGSV